MLRGIYTMSQRTTTYCLTKLAQNPWVLFKMLDGLNEDNRYYDNEHLRMFYGEEGELMAEAANLSAAIHNG